MCKHMKRKRKKYTEEFRISVVKEYLAGGISKHGLCKKYSIPQLVTLNTWIRKFVGDDKSLLQNLHDETRQTELRNMLKPFYGVLKTMNGCIKFALLTGVTKFRKVSVFSDLNNLDDLSMRRLYATLFGISEEELHAYFDKDIHTLASSLNLSFDGACSLLKKWYDGYHFVENTPGVYNPFSLLNIFNYSQLSDYWFETGTPSYLVELLKQTDYNLYDMVHTQTNADVLNSINIASRNPIPVIYQSSYLTIKEYDPRFKTHTLGFPNQEVEKDLSIICCPIIPLSRIPDFARTHRLGVENRPLHLCHGVQVERHGRRGVTTDRGQAIRFAFCRKRKDIVQDRNEFQQ